MAHDPGYYGLHLPLYESDFIPAKNYLLLPSDLDWKEWLDILHGWIPALFDGD
jgi:hypothetical protein